jgi:glutaconate CoA-transferase subunit B
MTTTLTTYTRDELLVARAARELKNGDIVFVGIGLPNRAANLARRVHAPDAQLVYESGVYGSVPERWPESIGDPCLVINAIAVQAMAELFLFYLQRGWIDVGFLGAAQIDRFANLNTTVVGDYRHPKVRLPGSGGACDIALLSKKLVVTLAQSTRSFAERVDFVTSPGNGAGVPFRPITVITDMAVFAASRVSGELEVVSLHPGVTLDDLRQHMAWDPRIAVPLQTTEAPTDRELEIIREGGRA